MSAIWVTRNFSPNAVGALPDEWTQLGGAAFAVATASPVSGTKSAVEATFHSLGYCLMTGIAGVTTGVIHYRQKMNLIEGKGAFSSPAFMSADGQNGLLLAIDYSENNTATPFKRTGGNYATLDSSHNITGYADGDIVNTKMYVDGTNLKWKIWKQGDPEPAYDSVAHGITPGSWYFGIIETSTQTPSDGVPNFDDVVIATTTQTLPALPVADRTLTHVTSGGVDISVIVPGTYDGSAPTGIVLYHMGHSEDRDALDSEDRKAGIRDRMLEEGYILAAVSAGSANWGNDDALAAYAIAHAYLLDNYQAAGVVLLPQSMGGVTGFRAAHDPVTFRRIKGVYAIYPVCDVLAEHDDNGGFSAEILSSWGAVDRAALVAALAGKNPTGLTNWPASVRYRFHASDDDTVVLKAHNTDVLFGVLAAQRTRENTLVETSGEHGDASNFDPDDLSEFLADAFSVGGGSGMFMMA